MRHVFCDKRDDGWRSEIFSHLSHELSATPLKDVMCISIGLVKPSGLWAMMPRLRLEFKVKTLIDILQEEDRYWCARARPCVDICASPWMMLSLNSPPPPAPLLNLFILHWA